MLKILLVRFNYGNYLRTTVFFYKRDRPRMQGPLFFFIYYCIDFSVDMRSVTSYSVLDD